VFIIKKHILYIIYLLYFIRFKRIFEFNFRILEKKGDSDKGHVCDDLVGKWCCVVLTITVIFFRALLRWKVRWSLRIFLSFWNKCQNIFMTCSWPLNCLILLSPMWKWPYVSARLAVFAVPYQFSYLNPLRSIWSIFCYKIPPGVPKKKFKSLNEYCLKCLFYRLEERLSYFKFGSVDQKWISKN